MEHEVIRDITAILKRPYEIIQGIIAMHVISAQHKQCHGA
jgi:hypothetical protein